MIYILGKYRKNSRFLYFVANLSRLCIPGLVYRLRRMWLLRPSKIEAAKHLKLRADYYCKLEAPCKLGVEASKFGFNLFGGHPRNYQFDLGQYLRYWNRQFRIHYRMGDNTHLLDVPTFTKARVIEGDVRNLIVFNMDKVRHFDFVHDRLSYQSKEDQIVWRGPAYQPWRIEFLNRWFGHPRCDIGRTDKNSDGIHQRKPWMSVTEQLKYKFILSIEGNDVATNLKWIMSSNSLCFMTRPTKETWFMEGLLKPNYHYVMLKNDCSDLLEKMDYYLAHEDEALAIIDNAHKWVVQFQNPRDEEIVSLLVLQKYFKMTGSLKT